MEKLKDALRKKFGIKYPLPTDNELNQIIQRIRAISGTPTESDWHKVVMDIIGPQDLFYIKGQDMSDLNMLLAQAISGLKS